MTVICDWCEDEIEDVSDRDTFEVADGTLYDFHPDCTQKIRFVKTRRNIIDDVGDMI